MKSDRYQIRRNVIHSTGLTFHLVGLLRYLDLPAYVKIGQCYKKANAFDRQTCRLYDVPHQFNADMQTDAWQWLRKWL